jgi:hypothetical protein
MNIVVLSGYVSKVYPSSTSAGQREVCNFEIYTDENSRRVFHSLSAWDRLVPFAASLKVDQHVVIHGRISYTDKGEGENKKRFTNIIADRIE